MHDQNAPFPYGKLKPGAIPLMPMGRCVERQLREGDQTAPIRVEFAECQPADLDHNRSLLSYSYEVNKRPLIRISFEVWGVRGGIGQYRRLHKKHAMVSCPYPRQAEVAIEYVMNSIKALNGKWLKEERQ